MRNFILYFVLGLTAGMWLDAALVEVVAERVWEITIAPAVDVNEELIDEVEIENLAPGPNWLNDNKSRYIQA